MNNKIQCPFCDNNIIIEEVQAKSRITCPACNSSFECKVFSEDGGKYFQPGVSAYSKTYKRLLTVIILISAGIGFFFYRAYEKNAKNEKTIQDIHRFFAKVHPKRNFNEIEVRRSIADSLSIPYYISDTDKTVDEVTISVNREIETLLGAKYPERSIDDFMPVAKEELGFTMYKPDMNQENLDSLVEYETEKEMKDINSRAVKFDEESELKKIALELKIQLPLEAPKNSITECEKLINDEIDKEVFEKLGKSKNEEIKELMQKYKPYKIGDVITVDSSRYGIVKGTYYGRDGAFLKVGEMKLLINDIPKYLEDPRFNENQCDKLQLAGSLLINKKYNDEKKNMIPKLKEKYIKSVREENGYLFYNGNWVSAKNTALEMLEKKRKAFAEGSKDQKTVRESISKECKNRIYIQHGYAVSDGNLTPVNILIEKKASEFLEKSKEKNSARKEQFKKDTVYDLYVKHGFIRYNGQLVPGKNILDKLVAEKNCPLLLENELKIAMSNITVDKAVPLPNTEKISADALFIKGRKLYDSLNYADAVPLIYAATLKGHPKATQLLAYCYQNGNFVRQDPKMAFQLFIKAAVLDGSLASNNIVEAYKNGQVVQKSPDFEADWLAFIESSAAEHVEKPVRSP